MLWVRIDTPKILAPALSRGEIVWKNTLIGGGSRFLNFETKTFPMRNYFITIMAMERVFAREGSLVGANGRNAGQVAKGTEFVLTGKFAIENGWKDRSGVKHNEDRKYAYFEGTRNGKAVEGGVSASVFLRRPFNGFTEEQTKQLTPFSQMLVDCGDAGDLDTVLEKVGAYAGKKIVCTDIIYNKEVPYGQKDERNVPYSVFDIK